MANLNYEKLMSYSPTSFGTWVNKLGQTIEFFEHPIKGGDAEVICACHDLKLAAYSGFFETVDMIQPHREYEPSFQDNTLYIGDIVA